MAWPLLQPSCRIFQGDPDPAHLSVPASPTVPAKVWVSAAPDNAVERYQYSRVKAGGYLTAEGAASI